MRYIVFNDPRDGMAYLTTESPAGRDDAPVLAVRAGDVDGDFGPADLIYDESGPVMRAASLVEVWASSPERSDVEIEMARRFLRQWPEGPQVAEQIGDRGDSGAAEGNSGRTTDPTGWAQRLVRKQLDIAA